MVEGVCEYTLLVAGFSVFGVELRFFDLNGELFGRLRPKSFLTVLSPGLFSCFEGVFPRPGVSPSITRVLSE